MGSNAQNCFWAKKAGGGNYDFGTGIATNKAGNIYTTGYFQSSAISFGSTTLYNQSIPNSSNSDIFLAKYDLSGNLLWAKGWVGTRVNQAMLLQPMQAATFI
ncbi:MAG: SBBP repeat-containing protein [Bacteroidetes bacterium]|nr:SBBP repeat-containing protein [Bacteroidota bacterium]